MKLTRSINKRWTIVVDIANETTTAIALDLGSLPLNAPVVEGLEEGSNLVLFLEGELGGIDGGEGEGTLVASLEVEIRGESVGGVEVEVGSAFGAAIDGTHCCGVEISLCHVNSFCTWRWRMRD